MERLGTVAGLEQEAAAGRHLGQRLAQLAGLTGEHQRRQRAQPLGTACAAAGSGQSGWCSAGARRARRTGDQLGMSQPCGFSPSCAPLRTDPSIGCPLHGPRVLRHPAHRHKHLGNYIGAIRHYVADQDLGEAFYCVVDLHAVSVPYDPTTLRENTLDTAATLLAAGLDPDRCTLFVQSHVHEHA